MLYNLNYIKYYSIILLQILNLNINTKFMFNWNMFFFNSYFATI